MIVSFYDITPKVSIKTPYSNENFIKHTLQN